MQRISHIRTLAQSRLEEADCLLQNGFSSAAYYLAGYAVELTLKARVCHHLDIQDFYVGDDIKPVKQAFMTHNLEQLLMLAGLKAALEEKTSSTSPNFDRTLSENWNIILRWNESKRYESSISQTTAAELIQALGDPQNGILSWLAKHF